MTRARLARFALRAVTLIAIAATLVTTLARVSLHGVVAVLSRADVPMLALVVPSVLALSFVLRAARFRALLGNGSARRASFGDVLGSVVVSQAANNVLPLRAGELVRTRDFVVRGYPLGRVASAQIMEKGIELLTLTAWTAPVLIRGRLVHWPILASVLLVALVLGAAIWIWRRIRDTEDTIALLGSLQCGFRDLASAVAWSFLADGLEVALIHICLESLGIRGGIEVDVTVLAAVNLAIALPSMPASFGALEAGAALGLVIAGVPRESAVGFALLYRVVQWVPVTLAGAVVWWLRRPPQNAHARAVLP